MGPPKRSWDEVRRKMRRQQTRKPFSWSTGPSDIIRYARRNGRGYDYFEYVRDYPSKEQAQRAAKAIRANGIKARVIRHLSVVQRPTWVVYQEIEVIR